MLTVLEMGWSRGMQSKFASHEDDQVVLYCHLIWSSLRMGGRKWTTAENEQCCQESQVEGSVR